MPPDPNWSGSDGKVQCAGNSTERQVHTTSRHFEPGDVIWLLSNYVPLNDGYNWKGDPNATTSGQAIPQLPPGTPGSTALPPAPLAVAEYDPATGTYVGPDGKTYTQANLARDANQHQTWQDMLSPPKGH
jgi:hypothetical protein